MQTSHTFESLHPRIRHSRSFSSSQPMKPSSLQTPKTPMRSKSKESPQSQSKRSDTSPNPIEAAKPPKIVVKNLNSAFSDISEEITPDPSIPSALVTDPDISAVDLLEASITSPDAMDQESVVPKKPTKELIAMDVPEPKREIGNSDTMKKVREEKGWSSNQESLMKLNIRILCALTWAALLANFLLVFPLHGSRDEGELSGSSLPPT